MEKREFSLEQLKKFEVLSTGYNTVYKLDNGEVLKSFHPTYIEMMSSVGVNLENKILNATNVSFAPEILIPTSASYLNGRFFGYTLPSAKGVPYSFYDSSLSYLEYTDLYQYAKVYAAIEKPVRNTSNIVFPDLCTCDNIFISKDKDDFQVQFIDYDGLQVDQYRSIMISSSLGDQSFLTDKYYKNDFFTKDLDIKSLTHLYFLAAFNINLSRIGMLNPVTGSNVSLEDMFEFIRLDDWDVMDKVYKIFHEKSVNEYLGDDVFNLAEEYRLVAIPNSHSPIGYVKVLEKK